MIQNHDIEEEVITGLAEKEGGQMKYKQEIEEWSFFQSGSPNSSWENSVKENSPLWIFLNVLPSMLIATVFEQTQYWRWDK